MKVLDALDLSSQQIHHIADGSASDDAASYGQVLNLVNGLDFKQSVRASSTGNVTVAAPGASIDGVALSSSGNGDRVLLKNQTTASENGLYNFRGAATPLTRTADGVTGELTSAATVVVTEGTVNIGLQYTLATSDPITVGTTSQTWSLSGSQTPDTADPNGGLQKVGTQFSVKLPASSGLVKDSTGLYLDSAIAVRKFAQNVGDGVSTSIVVTHNLGTQDIHMQLLDSATKAAVLVDWAATSVSTLTLTFAVAPASNAYRCVVHG